MIKRLYLTSLLLLVAIAARAVTVTSQPGKLAQVVTDFNITTLTINGSVDARDFKFIFENLNKLSTLNMSAVTIVQYNATEADGLLGGIAIYEANAIPFCGLTGLTSLTSVTLPNNLTSIGYAAFAGCSGLKNITFPSSLKKIGDEAFNSCTSITTVTIGNNITQVGSSAFARCSNLTTVVINPDNQLSLGEKAFMACSKLSNLNLGRNVNAIGEMAFSGCTSLKEVNITEGSTLTSIGEQAFYKTGLKAFDFSSTPNLTHLGAWSMANTQLTSIDLPANVKSLDEGIFFYNTKLSKLTLPKTLNYMPDYMLAGCKSLSTTSFMTQNMGSVGDYALYNQSQHSAITVPFKVYYIGTRAMAGMIGLKTISSEALNVPELGDDVWAGIKKSKVKLNVNKESINQYKLAPQWNEFFVNVATLRGDVNGDGFVTTADVIAERGYIAEGITQGINLEQTDVNGDGEVDVADITAIYNIINGTEPFATAQRISTNDWIKGDGQNDGNYKSTLSLRLNNTINYTAFQLEIVVPSHTAISEAKASSRCVGHEILLKKQNDVTYLLMGYSPANDDIEGYDGFFITLQILSSKYLHDNDQIDITKTLFVDYQENVYSFAENHIKIKGVSSIEDLNIDNEVKLVNVYNTQGQLIRTGVESNNATQGLPSGIYIVGGKKVIVR